MNVSDIVLSWLNGLSGGQYLAVLIALGLCMSVGFALAHVLGDRP